MVRGGGRLEELVDTYARGWSDPDPVVRRQCLATSLTESVTYTDPTAHVVGRDALADHLDGFQAQWPGARIGRTTAVDAHGTVARFGWHLVQADGTEALVGVDFVELADDSRIARVVGFFGPLA
jgi:hypothetical protein